MSKQIEFEFTVNSKPLEDALDNAEKKSKKVAMSIGDIASAVASAFAGSRIFGFFSSAIQEANKLEGALAKVSSVARSVGQSTEAAKKAALSLAEDGFMSAEQAAQSLANLMQVGLNLDQAKKFVTAAKDITAFGNTIGDAAQATEDLTLGLLRGSALVIDNASPALKSLSREYEQLLTTKGKAAAAQYAYNAILKESAKFSGDAAKSLDTLRGKTQQYNASIDSLKAAIGQSLQPVMKALYDVGIKLVDGFTKWFTSLSSNAQTIVSLGVAFSALTVILAGLLPVLTLVKTALLAMLANPIVLAITGVIALVTAIGVVIANANRPLAERAEIAKKAYQAEQAELQKLTNTLQTLEKVRNRTLAQERELALSKDKLREKARALGLDYDALVRKLGSYEKALIALERKAREKAVDEALAPEEKERDKRLEKYVNAQAQYDQMVARRRELTSKTNLLPSESVELTWLNSNIERYRQKAADAQIAYKKLDEDLLKKRKEMLADVKDTPSIVPTSSVPVGDKAEIVRFIETQKKLQQIELDRIKTVRDAQQVADAKERERRIQQANADADMRAKAAIDEHRHAVAQYIEDKYGAERLALQKQTRDAQRASNEILEAELIQAGDNAKKIFQAKKEHEERLHNIRIAHARKEQELMAKSFAETAKAAEMISRGLAGIVNARDPGGLLSGVGGMAQGASKLFPALEALGPIGEGIGAVGGIVSTFISLFGESEEERRREAEEQRRRDEEARKLLELQANYQKAMLALQEAQAKLPFENLQRNLRLVDIQAQQEILAGGDKNAIEARRLARRQELMQGVLSEQSGKIAEGALFKDVQATPEGLTKFLSERAAQDTAVGQFVEYANRALGNVGSIEELQQYYNFMASLASRIPPELAAAGLNAVGRKIANFWEKYRIVDSQYSRDYTTRENRSRFIQNFLLAANYGIGTVRINAKRKDFFDIERINDNGLEAINKLASEIRSDTTVAENLLSVLQESLANQIAIEEHTRKTAENTKLQLEKDRGDAFVDIAAGGLRQQDSFLAFSPITLGAQMQSVLLSSLALQTATKTDNQLLAELVGLNKDMRLLLAEIALNTNRSAGNFGGMSETELLALLSDFKSKS